MQDFRNIVVWQKSHQFVLLIYKLTKGFPSVEQFGVTSQIRRAALSIPSNIAEGSCRGSDKDFARFIQIALGSAAEVEYLILLSRDLEYLSIEEFDEANLSITEIKRMLSSLIKKLSK